MGYKFNVLTGGFDLVGGGTPAWGDIIGTLANQTDLQTALDAKQATLVSGTNIKTINSTSLLGSGNISISTTPGGSDTQIQFNDGGSFGGDAGLTYNKTTDTLSVVNLSTVAVINGRTTGAMDLTGGTPSGGGQGRDVSLRAGTGGGASGNSGGIAYLLGGTGDTSDGTGGNAYIRGGTGGATNGNGGDVIIQGGIKTGSGTAGRIRLYNPANLVYATLDPTAISSNNTFTFPNRTGYLALATQGADVGSANNLALGSDGNVFEITGAVQINLISNIGFTNGTYVTLLFTSNPTVKHNQATSTTNITIQLAGAADFVASAGDTLTLVLSEIGGTQAWREVARAVI